MSGSNQESRPIASGRHAEDPIIGPSKVAPPGNTIKRQQGTQACQRCRRRKVKCDEVRPTCSSCERRHSECAYDLPAGKTRMQSLVQSDQRLREELRSHGSLVYALRCVDSDEATQILRQLRRGDYDKLLLGRDPAFGSDGSTSRGFPWEYPAHVIEEILDLNLETLSYIPASNDARPDCAIFSQPQPTWIDSNTIHPCGRYQGASVCTTPGSGFPPRLSLDKILSKPEETLNVTTAE